MKPGHLLLPAAFLAATLLVGGQAVAHPGPAEPHGCPGYGSHGPYHGFGPCWQAEKTITQEQRAKYYAIQKEYEPKLRELKDQLFIKQNELQALKHSAQPDIAAVRATATEIVKLKNAKRELMQAIAQRVEKECGITRAERPIPGIDFPKGPFPGPHHGHGHGMPR